MICSINYCYFDNVPEAIYARHSLHGKKLWAYISPLPWVLGPGSPPALGRPIPPLGSSPLPRVQLQVMSIMIALLNSSKSTKMRSTRCTYSLCTALSQLYLLSARQVYTLLVHLYPENAHLFSYLLLLSDTIAAIVLQSLQFPAKYWQNWSCTPQHGYSDMQS